MIFESRDQIEEQYQWDLSSMFASDEDFLSALEQAKSFSEAIAAFQGKVSQSPQELLSYLQLDDEISIAFGKLINYAQRKADEDTRNALYQDYAAQVMALYTEVASACAWFAPELLKLSDETMDEYYSMCPELELYRRALHMIFRRREHVLGDEEELILARASDMAMQPEHIYSLFNDADLVFEDAIDAEGQSHAVTHGSYIPLMMSDDRELRKSAFTSMYAAYGQFRNSAAAMLGAQVKQLKFFSDVRKYPSSLDYCLDATEVPTEVYHNLIATVRKHLGPMYTYVDLRKRALGLDELHFYDLYVPIVEDVDMEFTYEQACELILNALEPMGEEYLALVRKGLSERWVDVYETPGKRSGAYSAGGYGMHPVMLLNYQEKLDDVYTLIHEMGHSIHTYLSCHNQPSVYSDYVIFVAEVASTCNEALLTQYLLKTRVDPAERAYVLNHFLEQFRGTIYRQTMFAEFELKANEIAARGEGITADALSDIYRKLNEDYFGPGVVVGDEIAVEWARIPHFYYQYYVYQYATGFSAAIALSNRILNEGAPAVKDYLGFLSGGSSKTPIELLKGAGVDMASPAPIEDALAYFNDLVDELASLLAI